ncbi:MAG TPA: cysteine hydrolase [Actinomycetota bacterium]
MIELPRDRTAMCVVEMQNDLVSPELLEARGLRGALARAVHARRVLDKLPPVLEACRARGVPVLYLTKERDPALPQPDFPPIYGSGGADPILVRGSRGAAVVDALAPADGDLVLARATSLDPSYGSELWSVLRRLGTTTLIVAGISTTIAVEGLVRAAANRAYRVAVVEDCCASVPEEWHDFSARNVLPLLADVVRAIDVARALA